MQGKKIIILLQCSSKHRHVIYEGGTFDSVVKKRFCLAYGHVLMNEAAGGKRCRAAAKKCCVVMKCLTVLDGKQEVYALEIH